MGLRLEGLPAYGDFDRLPPEFGLERDGNPKFELFDSKSKRRFLKYKKGVNNYRVSLGDGRNAFLKILDSNESSDNKHFCCDLSWGSRLRGCPNIVEVLAYGEINCRPSFLMEYADYAIDNCNLRISRVLDIFKDVALGLGYAHEKRVVHCDVKPGNILVFGGRAKIGDWGIAIREGERNCSADDEQGSVLGTSCFMSPEQAIGECLDRRSDVYSFGATLYHMLSLQKPFPCQGGCTDRKCADVMFSHVFITPKRVREIRPEIPESVEQIVMRCMEKGKNDRYQNMGEVVGAIDGEIGKLKNQG